MSDKEPMDTDAVLEGLGRALVFQHRSTIQFATASGSLFGLEFQSLGERLWEWSERSAVNRRPTSPACAGVANRRRRSSS